MTILLFTWYLLTFPTDKLICSLWVNQPPTQSGIVQACGTADLSAYQVNVINIAGSGVLCTRPAAAVMWVVEDCRLPETLDNYRLNIVKPNVTELVCSITVEHTGEPTAEEIRTQCKGAKPGTWKLVQTAPKPEADKPKCAAASLTVGPSLYQQAADADELMTNDELTWLAGRMIWFGLVHPMCDGASGLDPVTLAATPCGVNAARSLILSWQNKFDGEIYAASVSASVPARLLKRIMKVESQFWPMWSDKTGETGLLQITENGADVLLRYDPSLDVKYPTRKMEEQYWTKLALLNSFRCDLCDLDQTIRHTRSAIPMYARTLAAYRCRAVEMNPSLSGDDAWRQAVSDYNGGNDYLRRVEQ